METHDLALRLLDYEAAAFKTFGPVEAPVLRVYEKLRRSLCELIGVAGFRSLASRSLTLAKWEAPSLGAMQVTADGYLEGLIEFDAQVEGHKTGEGEIILIAQLLGLLFTFIGEALSIRIVQEGWPDLDLANPGAGGKHEHKK